MCTRVRPTRRATILCRGQLQQVPDPLSRNTAADEISNDPPTRVHTNAAATISARESGGLNRLRTPKSSNKDGPVRGPDESVDRRGHVRTCCCKRATATSGRSLVRSLVCTLSPLPVAPHNALPAVRRLLFCGSSLFGPRVPDRAYARR